LKLKHDELLSNVAFNCNLRHYTEADGVLAGQALANQIMAAVDPDLEVSWSKYDGDTIAKVGRCRLTPL